MNFKKYHVSRNLWNGTLVSGTISNQGIEGDSQGRIRASIFTELESGTYTLDASALSEIEVFVFVYNTSGTFVERIPTTWTSLPYTFSLESRSKIKFVFAYAPATSMIAIQPSDISNIMLNTGSQPLPYEPYSSEVWHDTPHYIHNTSTDTITTLPAVVYPNDTTATVGLKGQAVQSSTPSPTSPVMPEGCGNKTANLFDITATTSGKYVRDTDGTLGNYADTSATDYIDVSGINTLYPQYFTDERPVRQWAAFYDSSKTFVSGFSGYNQAITVPNDAAYVRLTVDNSYASNFTVSPLELESYEPFGVKIPISSAGQTTPIYLGETQTVRYIKKLVLTGEEDITSTHTDVGLFNIPVTDYLKIANVVTNVCTHYLAGTNIGGWADVTDRTSRFYANPASPTKLLYIRDSSYTTIDDFKAYLAAQYAAGTPVCVWYVLASETTGIVNEPLMRIGDYADTLSNISIPVTAGGDTLSVGTTVQPSEVTVNYKGWHPVADVHEKSKNLFDKDRTVIGERVLQNSVTADASTAHSDYIDVTGVSTLTVNKKYIATNFYFYADKTNASIGYVNDFTANVPARAKYCRINVLKDDVDTIMLNTGSTALPYEPYWK